MLTPGRSLRLHIDSGKELPRVQALTSLYARGVKPRQGDTIMIAGRSGTQKSGFALWWTASMNLPTIYFSADMAPFTASTRLAALTVGETTEEVEAGMASGKEEYYEEALRDSRIHFAFGPLSWESVDLELQAYVELWDQYPQVVVFDNLMDFAGAESDYTEQMAVMQEANTFARETGATVIILHHASDKSWDARTAPYDPPSRDQVKGGLSEKPELALSVALDPNTLEYRVACIKQRMGPSDPTARTWATLRAEPEKTRFHALGLAPRVP